MAFWGKSFIFDGYPCEDFDLMIYDIGSSAQGASEFASTASIVDESLPSKWKPIFYGVKFDSKLCFTIVFGVNQHRIDDQNYLDRYEIDTIATWLTGHQQYKWLAVEQDDMTFVRYKCIFTSLECVEYGRIPWAMKAEVTCDSPYAYMYPHEYQYTLNGTAKSITFFNESSINGYYRPIIEYSTSSGGNLEIINNTDNGRIFKFTGLSSASQQITIDNENCVITSSADTNIYDKFNYNFFRLKRGYNQLQITGNGTLKILCEFPINVGG